MILSKCLAESSGWVASKSTNTYLENNICVLWNTYSTLITEQEFTYQQVSLFTLNSSAKFSVNQSFSWFSLLDKSLVSNAEACHKHSLPAH